MINKNNNLATFFLRRRASWLAVLPIALLQLSIAVHQVDHVADYIDGACHICAQLDRTDTAADHSLEKPLPASINDLPVETPKVSAARNSVRLFDSRAPPRI